ncbi:unnamed protein product [Clonostachys rosea]|uniref:Uncharacterized protein n=1 Tax=Bionectria ochroleuca TaxID=29856 RepID=A0ABY6TTC8_BIOOC|nr:unnamed protein product [Clonostachys rosea]
MDLATSPRGSIASQVASVSTDPTTLASTDTDGLPRIRFQTTKLLAEQIGQQTYQALDDILYVEDVSPEDFTLIQEFRESSGRKYRFKRYYPEHQLLIITIPTKYHESLHSFIYDEIRGQIRDMGLRFHWATTSAATFYREHGRTGSGEGDSSGHPIQPGRDSSRRWPTIVIEAGYSQSLPQLREDMLWWFRESNHQVKVVLLVKMYRGPLRKITIEHWREEPMTFPGARTRQRAQQLEPTCAQAIHIIKTSVTVNDFLPSSYGVTRGALELRFSDLFLRGPVQGEGNIVIGVDVLQWFGATVAHMSETAA